MGAMVALTLYSLYPDKIFTLNLIAPPFSFLKSNKNNFGYKKIVFDIMKESLRKDKKKLYITLITKFFVKTKKYILTNG